MAGLGLERSGVPGPKEEIAERLQRKVLHAWFKHAKTAPSRRKGW